MKQYCNVLCFFYIDQSKLSRWKSTLAVAFLRHKRSVHVVFEPAPAEFGVTQYTLLLLKNGTKNDVMAKLVSNRNLKCRLLKVDQSLFDLMLKPVWFHCQYFGMSPRDL